MIMAVLALAAGVALGAAPVPRNLKAWTNASLYPVGADFAGGRGQVGIEIVVDAAGTPLRCDVTTSSGVAILDASSCQVPLERARFDPARDEDGQRVAGVYAYRFDWRARSKPVALTPDFSLSVSRLPTGIAAPTAIIRITTTPTGTIERCAVERSSGDAQLDRAACASTGGGSVFAAARGGDGTPVRAVRRAVVAFTTAG